MSAASKIIVLWCGGWWWEQCVKNVIRKSDNFAEQFIIMQRPRTVPRTTAGRLGSIRGVGLDLSQINRQEDHFHCTSLYPRVPKVGGECPPTGPTPPGCAAHEYAPETSAGRQRWFWYCVCTLARCRGNSILRTSAHNTLLFYMYVVGLTYYQNFTQYACCYAPLSRSVSLFLRVIASNCTQKPTPCSSCKMVHVNCAPVFYITLTTHNRFTAICYLWRLRRFIRTKLTVFAECKWTLATPCIACIVLLTQSFDHCVSRRPLQELSTISQCDLSRLPVIRSK